MNRSEIIERLGACFATIHRNTCYPYAEDFEKEAAGMTLLHIVQTEIPGIADVLDGTAVVVPVEATDDMVRASCSTTCERLCRCEEPCETEREAFARALAASPYRRPE